MSKATRKAARAANLKEDRKVNKQAFWAIISILGAYSSVLVYFSW